MSRLGSSGGRGRDGPRASGRLLLLSLALAGAPPVLVPVPLAVLVIDFGRSRSAASTGSVQRGKARRIGDYVVYVELVGDGRQRSMAGC